jgi:hypothetical protein
VFDKLQRILYKLSALGISDTVKGKKGKATPVMGHEGPKGCEMSRLPYFL